MNKSLKIYRYYWFALCLLLSVGSSFGQEVSDKEIGFDAKAIADHLILKGLSQKQIDEEIEIARQYHLKLTSWTSKRNQAVSKSTDSSLSRSTALSTASTIISADERAALVELYNRTGGPKWNNTLRNEKPWDVNNPNSDVSTWYGVQIEDGKLYGLFLSANNLSGQIPIEIGHLLSLQYLNLDYNNLTGPIPSQLGSLINLGSLSLTANNFEGAIPDFIGDLIWLEYLNLGYNKFTGSLPSTFSKLLNLVRCGVHHNLLEGKIFVGFTSPWIDYYYLSGNRYRYIDLLPFLVKYRPLEYISFMPQAKIGVSENLIAKVGQSITLRMFPLGDTRYLPEDTFQWFKDGILIPAATTPVYTITNLSAVHSGVYVCKTYNKYAADVFEQVELEQKDPDTVFIEREPITLLVSNCLSSISGQIMPGALSAAAGDVTQFYFEPSQESILTGDVVSYQWTITNSSNKVVHTATTATRFHSFAFPGDGTYNVKLEVSKESGCAFTFNRLYTIAPQNVCLNESFSFSFDTPTTGLQYVWKVTNSINTTIATTAASSSSAYTTSFAAPGVYTLTLTATNTVSKCSEIFTRRVNVVSCPPTSCRVHFNFNFRLPDETLAGTGMGLNYDSRANLAKGIVDFLSINPNKKLFVTTTDLTDAGAYTQVATKLEVKSSLGSIKALSSTVKDITNGPPVAVRIQDQVFPSGFTTIVNGLVANPSLVADDINVSFFVISEDQFGSSYAQAKTAYQNLINSKKAKKVFFILVKEGKFTYQSGTTAVARTPVQFLTDILGRPLFNYATRFSVANSDYVEFTKAEIAAVGFNNVLQNLLQKAYNDISYSCYGTQSCIKTSVNAPELKKLLFSVVNKLKDIPSGSDPNTFALKEIKALSHYTANKSDKIYNFVNSATHVSFSFAQSNTDFDVQLPKRLGVSIRDIDLSQYTDLASRTFVTTTFSDNTAVLDGFVRNIDFCVAELHCLSHIAIVLDESGSIDKTNEAEKIRKQLKEFIKRQAFINDTEGTNMHISLTGMSDQDANIRTDAVGPIRVTTNGLAVLDAWISNYGNRKGAGISEGSDFWKSGLDVVLNRSTGPKPKIVVVIADGCQSADPAKLRATMQRFDNYQRSPDLSQNKPHLVVVGLETGFYVDNPTSNVTPAINSQATGTTQTGSFPAMSSTFLNKSLQYLLNFPNNEFPVQSASNIDFSGSSYAAHSDFNIFKEDLDYLSDKLAVVGCSGKSTKNFCVDCISFRPEVDKEYLLGAWVKEASNVQVQDFVNPQIELIFYKTAEAADNVVGQTESQIISSIFFKSSGPIIDGWQRVLGRFQIPKDCITLGLALHNKSLGSPVYFDDIRIHPTDGSLKTFVYDSETYKLMSELDENNYATFYEYDNEGGLVRVKKETSRGVKTIQETRSGGYLDGK